MPVSSITDWALQETQQSPAQRFFIGKTDRDSPVLDTYDGRAGVDLITGQLAQNHATRGGCAVQLIEGIEDKARDEVVNLFGGKRFERELRACFRLILKSGLETVSIVPGKRGNARPLIWHGDALFI